MTLDDMKDKVRDALMKARRVDGSILEGKAKLAAASGITEPELMTTITAMMDDGEFEGAPVFNPDSVSLRFKKK